MAKKKMTGAEIIKHDEKDFEVDVKAMMEDAAPKTPLEAAIDRATGFKPEDAVKAIMGTDSAETGTEKPDSETEKPDSETEQGDSETEQGDSETEQGDSETKQGDSETKPAEDETRAETPATAKRDWVKEAYECFVKDAKDIDPTDPVKAIEAYFRKNATDELKARCNAEGKDAKGCWKFIEAVARKALGGRNGHIDPGVVYAIAMHWFEDVPKDWDAASAKATARQAKPAKTAKKKETKIEKLEQNVAQGQSEPVRQKAKEELRKAKATKKRKSKTQQGFFFEMLETPAGGGAE